MRPRLRPARTRPAGSRAGTAVGAALTALATAVALLPAAPVAADDPAPAPASGSSETSLHLVTLRSPGTASGRASAVLPGPLAALRQLAEQNRVLEAVGSPEPVYRWTTAVNGMAVELDEEQAATLAREPAVLDVVADTVRPLASTPTPASSRAALPEEVSAALAPPGPRRGGRGVVVGVVDTGLAPDSPVFAPRSSAGAPPGFGGACETGPDWPASACSGRVVGARTYVDGFGVDAVRAATPISPRDRDGHGTRTASLAVGNARVPVVVGEERLGTFGGQAPDASLAVYRACWNAPDPRDDGCSVADLVAAVDDAVRDGVDVLTLAVGGPSGIDVLERALLGATEAGVVVVAAAGNDGAGGAAHSSPWVLSVGGSTGAVRRGEVVLPGGQRLAGAMASRRGRGPTRVVRAADAAATGVRAAEARVCAPGSLDAREVAGAVVVCDRGQVGRVVKSRTVALADGVAMVLLNRDRGSVDADVHSVPTVHLPAGAGRVLRRALADRPGLRVALRPRGTAQRPARVAGFSGSGTGSDTVDPDVVAPATNVLAAVPAERGSWDVDAGTSAAAAVVAGVAATLLARGADPAQVRSALVTTARPLRRSPVTRAGAGLVRARAARRPGLAVLTDPAAYRAWLDGDAVRLNSPTVVLAGGRRTTTRRVTNVSGRRLYFSSSAVGFRRDVRVSPAALRLGPGESATFRVTAGPRRGSRVDDGYVVWRGATGTTTRVPVVLTR
ncbi:S8 family serine peptidase [Nocardioides litoris]|uniref:S8 family serine peptidase n=1 Tax=Nocardioides litoris TaxID=1926648 RepID=UPI0014773F6C|nr:S8 family serine peptidase [Nocardioides litoris]